jgi:predicted GNAT family acetyltransferase
MAFTLSKAILSAVGRVSGTGLTRTQGPVLRMATPSFRYSSDSVDVVHDEKKNEFFVDMGKGKAVLQYTYHAPDEVELYHTEVPSAYRGKGLGAVLAKRAFDFVVNKELKMRVTCTYLQKYLKEHPHDNYLKRVV